MTATKCATKFFFFFVRRKWEWEREAGLPQLYRFACLHRSGDSRQPLHPQLMNKSGVWMQTNRHLLHNN